MDGQPGWSFNARRKSMQGGEPNHRRSLNIGNNVVSVDDLYKVGVVVAALLLLLPLLLLPLLLLPLLLLPLQLPLVLVKLLGTCMTVLWLNLAWSIIAEYSTMSIYMVTVWATA
jgi:hypothetical protein